MAGGGEGRLGFPDFWFGQKPWWNIPLWRISVKSWGPSYPNPLSSPPCCWSPWDIFRAFRVCSDAKERVGCNGKLPHLFIPGKAATLFTECAVEDLPFNGTTTLVPAFAVKDLPLEQSTLKMMMSKLYRIVGFLTRQWAALDLRWWKREALLHLRCSTRRLAQWRWQQARRESSRRQLTTIWKLSQTCSYTDMLS